MMDSLKAVAILAFCAGAHAAALPQFPGLSLPANTSTSASAGASTAAPPVALPGFPLSGTASVPASLPVPSDAIIEGPVLDDPVLPLPTPDLPVPLPRPSSTAASYSPTPGVGDAAADEALSKIVELGTAVFELILDTFAKGAAIVSPPVHDAPVRPPIGKRQLAGIRPTTLAAPTGLPAVGGLTSSLGGLISSAPVVGGVASPLGAVTAPVSGAAAAASPLGAVTAPVSGAAGAASPLGAVTGASPLGAVTGASPLGAVTGALPSVANVPVAGPAVGGAVDSLSNFNGLSSALNGIPGTDPVGAFSLSVIATLLSLLKKDPLVLFGGSLGTLGKRDLPEAGLSELEKRQLNSLPSLSSGIPGIGIGGLPLSGIPGIPADLTYLVGTIARNIAVPGGTGIGSITTNILRALNGIVPNFIYKLPVVQESVPTFGVVQLLTAINPSKFGTLVGLDSLASLQQAATAIPAGDLRFIRGLPVSPDPSSLITNIMTFADNILSLPDSVANLRASVSVLCMKNLGLAVPGL